MLVRFAAAFCVALGLASSSASAEIRRIDYDGFTVWVDCAHRGPTLFHYIARADSGSLPRATSFAFDPNVPRRCQSKINAQFQPYVPAGALAYDIGHQVPANHFDGSALAIKETNYWTNVLPQTASMNRGAWLATEYLIECIRDQVPLEVWGGPIWGNNPADDYFVASHGIETPDAFWKVVIRTDNRQAMAWIIPNGKAPQSSLDKWIQSVAAIEVKVGRTFNAVNKTVKPVHSWKRPAGCSVK